MVISLFFYFVNDMWLMPCYYLVEENSRKVTVFQDMGLCGLVDSYTVIPEELLPPHVLLT
jgi:hypothetical protein